MSSATAHSFNKLLSQPKASSKSRASGELDDGTKKLRRMILVEGIPSAVVRPGILPAQPLDLIRLRILLYVRAFGRYSFVSTNYQRRLIFITSLVGLVKFAKRLETIPFGERIPLFASLLTHHILVYRNIQHVGHGQRF